MVFHPKQIGGIKNAVDKLLPLSETDDEMVHINELHDGSGALRVELTNPSKAYYVRENGELAESRKELESD